MSFIKHQPPRNSQKKEIYDNKSGNFLLEPGSERLNVKESKAHAG